MFFYDSPQINLCPVVRVSLLLRYFSFYLSDVSDGSFLTVDTVHPGFQQISVWTVMESLTQQVQLCGSRLLATSIISTQTSTFATPKLMKKSISKEEQNSQEKWVVMPKLTANYRDIQVLLHFSSPKTYFNACWFLSLRRCLFKKSRQL